MHNASPIAFQQSFKLWSLQLRKEFLTLLPLESITLCGKIAELFVKE